MANLSGDSYGLGGGVSSSSSFGTPSYAKQVKPTSSIVPRQQNGLSPATDAQAPTYSYMGSDAAATLPSAPSAAPGMTENASALSAGAPSGADPVASDQFARGVQSSLDGAGHETSWSGNQLMVDGRPYEVGAPNAGQASTSSELPSTPAASPGSDAGGPGVSSMGWGVLPDTPATGQPPPATQGPAPQSAPQSAPTAPTTLFGGAPIPSAPWGDGAPPSYAGGVVGPNAGGPVDYSDIPNFSADNITAAQRSGPSATALDRLMTSLESSEGPLDQRTVDTVNAQQKDALVQQGQLNDQELSAQGGVLGIGDSPWLAAQRNANRVSTGQAVAQGAANTRVQAATTNRAAQQQAAQTGTSYLNTRDQQVVDGVSAALARSNAMGQRMSLEAAIEQAAAASGQSAAQIAANWRLSQGQMQLTSAQAGAGYGLSLAQLKQQADAQAWQQSYLDNQAL